MDARKTNRLNTNQEKQALAADLTTCTNPLLDYPPEIAKNIGDYLSNKDLASIKLVSGRTHLLFTPQFEQRRLDKEKPMVTQALQYAARARKEDVEKLQIILNKNPSLLLVKSDVIASDNGFSAKNVTIYEFCLGAATEVKSLVEPFFYAIPGDQGLEERYKQYAKYAPHIKKMFTQPAYDWSDLLLKIKAAPAWVVDALVKTPMLPKEHAAYDSDLYIAMRKFRKDWAPGELDGNNPHMHDVMRTKDNDATEFSMLRSLREADENIYDKERDNLVAASRAAGDENKYNRAKLVWRQVIGFMERRLTGEDRCNVAQGLRTRFVENKALKRSDKFPYLITEGITTFDNTPDDDLLTVSDLGGGFGVDIYNGWAGRRRAFAKGDAILKNLCRAKTSTAQSRPMRPRPSKQSPGCVMS